MQVAASSKSAGVERWRGGLHLEPGSCGWASWIKIEVGFQSERQEKRGSTLGCTRLYELFFLLVHFPSHIKLHSLIKAALLKLKAVMRPRLADSTLFNSTDSFPL